MEKYLEYLYSAGVYKAEKIDAAGIITAPWTDYKCRYGCDFYGKRRSCPPYTHSWKETQEILDCYKYGILFNVREVSDLSGAAEGRTRECEAAEVRTRECEAGGAMACGDSGFAEDGAGRGRVCTHSEGVNVTELAVELSRMAFLDGYYKSIAYGSGPCLICKECDLNHCRYPKKTVPSMEGCGIDVFATARLNGFEIKTVKEKEDIHNYFGLVLFE